MRSDQLTGEETDEAAEGLPLDALKMATEDLEMRFRDLWGNNADEMR